MASTTRLPYQCTLCNKLHKDVPTRQTGRTSTYDLHIEYKAIAR